MLQGVTTVQEGLDKPGDNIVPFFVPSFVQIRPPVFGFNYERNRDLVEFRP